MAAATRRNFSKRTTPNFTERALGLGNSMSAKGHSQVARAVDYFTNMAARTGFGTPSLSETTEYELIRFSYDYWSLITLFRNHWISRRIVETPAIDMVRAWPRLTSDIDPKDLASIDRVLRKTGTKMRVQEGITWGRLFGGAGALIVIKGQEKELDQPLDLDTIELGSYRGLSTFDRWAGIQPDGEVCTDPSRPLDFNKPEFYRVTPVGGDAYRVHSTRILRFLGPEVPTPEREAQTWWGISVLEPIYEDIKKYDNMSWNILNLTFRANILGMKFPDLASLLSGLGASQKANQNFETRMSSVNHLISNQSLVPLPADGSIESTQYSFGGLDSIFQLFQLAISGGSQIPVTRLWGRTYNGLGATREQDEMLYEEKIAADQASQLVPQLEKLYPVLCMSELGEVPEDLDLVCPSIRVLDEKEKSELAKSVVDTVTVAFQNGIISEQIYAQELKQSSDVTGVFTNLTPEFISTLKAEKNPSESELGEGMFGEEGGEPNLSPSASPQKVLKETGKAKKEEGKGESEEETAEDKGKRNWLTASVNDAERPKPPREGGDYDQVYKGWGLKKVTLPDGRRQVRIYDKDGYVVDAVATFTDARAWLSRSQATDSDGPSQGEHQIHGLTCVVETPRGYSRHGRDDRGKPWRTVMPADYGYIVGHMGADGDSLDCYVGTDPDSEWVYVMDQAVLGNKRKYDEAKVMLGFPTQAAALNTYMKGHHRANDILLDWTPMRIEDFKYWLASRNPKKPCSTQVTV